MPPPPEPPRINAAAAWTGEEAIFLGGQVRPPCGMHQPCQEDSFTRDRYDGMAYSPSTGTWRRIPKAPLRFDASSGTAVLGERVFLLGGGKLLEYDADEDRWRTHDLPERTGNGLIGVDTALVFVGGYAEDVPDLLWGPSTQVWSPLPPDPHGGAGGRGVGTPHGYLRVSDDPDFPAGGLGAAPQVASLFDLDTRTWRALPPFVQGESGGWLSWTGEVVLDVGVGTLPILAGEHEGEDLPTSGRISLPSGEWGPLPGALEAQRLEVQGGWWIHATGGPLVAYQGLLYDDRSEGGAS